MSCCLYGDHKLLRRKREINETLKPQKRGKQCRDLPDSLSRRSEPFSECGDSGELLDPSVCSNSCNSGGSSRWFIDGEKLS